LELRNTQLLDNFSNAVHKYGDNVTQCSSGGNLITSTHGLRITWSQSTCKALAPRGGGELVLPPVAVDPHTGLKVNCTFNSAAWLVALQDYPNQDEAQVMLNGMQLGVDVRFSLTGSRGFPHSDRNLELPKERKKDAEEFIKQELDNDVKAQRRVGPFKVSPYPVYRVSPFGVVTKTGSSKLRLIHHLSWPRGRKDQTSVNDNIESLLCPLTSFDDAVRMLNSMGDLSDVWMFKVDIKSAYRCIPVRPADWPLLGGMLMKLLYFDMSLPFGMKSSCGIWECYATAAEWIVKNNIQLEHLLHYIDDYLGAVKGKEEAAMKLRLMLDWFNRLGIPVSLEKVEGPEQQLTFLGIMIDIQRKEIRLDNVKLQQARELLRSWEMKVKCTRKELLSLSGWFYWATKVVRGGRTFLRRIVDAARYRKHNGLQVIEPSVKGDLIWWTKFLSQYNGISMLPESNWTESWSNECQLFTDASSIGYGARWGDKYTYGKWNANQLSKVQGVAGIVIAVLELCGIVIAAITWGQEWKGKRITVRCDNTGAVAAINNGSCQNELLMNLVRELWYTSCTHLFELRAVHVPGVVNVDADDLSRDYVEKFRRRNPSVDSSPTTPQLPACLS
jgi:Reverse transcriptase (RNA-dependent DNA polymerase)